MQSAKEDVSGNFKNLPTTVTTEPDAALAAHLPATGLVKGVSRADLMVLACVTIWAFNVPMVKAILQYLEPLQTSLLRFATAGTIFALYVLLKEGSLRVARRHLALLVGAGVIGIMLNQVFFTYALKNTTSSEVSLLSAATPSFATIFAWIAGQEKIKFNYWLSLPVAILGVGLIVLTAPGASLGGNLLGDALAIGMASSWACYTVMVRPLLKHYTPARVSAYVLLIGAVGLLPFGLAQANWERMATMPFNIWLALLYSSLGAVVITNVLWFTGIRDLGAPRTAFYSYLQPFVGVFAAALILSEVIVPWQLVGGLLVVASMIVYRLRPKKAALNLQSDSK